MKSVLNICLKSFLVLLAVSCNTEPDPNLELFSPQAFAFDIGDYWEVNASVNAKGFMQKEVDETFIVKLSYSVDIITPGSDTVFSIFEDWVEEESPEEFMDTQLEAQIEIDSSFTEGKYKLIFNIKDELFPQSKSIAVDFNLSK